MKPRACSDHQPGRSVPELPVTQGERTTHDDMPGRSRTPDGQELGDSVLQTVPLGLICPDRAITISTIPPPV